MRGEGRGGDGAIVWVERRRVAQLVMFRGGQGGKQDGEAVGRWRGRGVAPVARAPGPWPAAGRAPRGRIKPLPPSSFFLTFLFSSCNFPLLLSLPPPDPVPTMSGQSAPPASCATAARSTGRPARTPPPSQLSTDKPVVLTSVPPCLQPLSPPSSPKARTCSALLAPRSTPPRPRRRTTRASKSTAPRRTTASSRPR